MSAERAVEQLIFQNEMYQCSNTEEESHWTISDSNSTICRSARSSDSGMTHKTQTTHVLLLYNSSSLYRKDNIVSLVPTEMHLEPENKNSSSHGRAQLRGAS